MILRAARFANAVDLKSMPCGEVVILEADFLLELADFLRKKLNRVTTLCANHVVMAAAVVLMFVTGDAVVEGDFAGQTAFRQQFQRAVYGRIADARIFFLHQTMKFVGREVITGFEKRAQNGISLTGLLQADALQVFVEDILGLPHHLAGNRWLIIDAILKHGGRN